MGVSRVVEGVAATGVETGRRGAGVLTERARIEDRGGGSTRWACGIRQFGAQPGVGVSPPGREITSCSPTPCRGWTRTSGHRDLTTTATTGPRGREDAGGLFGRRRSLVAGRVPAGLVREILLTGTDGALLGPARPDPGAVGHRGADFFAGPSHSPRLRPLLGATRVGRLLVAAGLKLARHPVRRGGSAACSPHWIVDGTRRGATRRRDRPDGGPTRSLRRSEPRGPWSRWASVFGDAVGAAAWTPSTGRKRAAPVGAARPGDIGGEGTSPPRGRLGSSPEWYAPAGEVRPRARMGPSRGGGARDRRAQHCRRAGAVGLLE